MQEFHFNFGFKVITTYRYGREEDEVMGLKFSKEMVIASGQIFPTSEKPDVTQIQTKLLKKLGENAYPFTFRFPEMAPSSITLQPGEDDQGKPLGRYFYIVIIITIKIIILVRFNSYRKNIFITE